MSPATSPDRAWIEQVLEVARAAARAGSAVHRQHAANASILEADLKGRSDYVSRTDTEAEAAVHDVITRTFPDHRIMAEESTDPEAITEADLEGPVWVVDPLDGTANFLHGHPNYACSVALALDGRPLVGVVDASVTDEVWWAGRGLGAWKNGTAIRVSPMDRLEHALIGTGFPFKREVLLDQYAAQLTRILKSTAGVRRAGAAAIDLAYVAEGTFEAFWELHLNPWDFAAGWVLIEEAGGAVARVDGSPLGLAGGTVAAANSPELLEALLGLVADSGSTQTDVSR